MSLWLSAQAALSQAISSNILRRVSGRKRHTNGMQSHTPGASSATVVPTEPTVEDSAPTKAGANTIPIRPWRLFAMAFAVARMAVGKTSAEIVAEIVQIAIMAMVRT
jgi:hypothetical protein